VGHLHRAVPHAVKEWLLVRYDEFVADVSEKAPCPAGRPDRQNDRLRMQRTNGGVHRIAGGFDRWDTASKKPSDYVGDFCVPLFVKALIFLSCCTPARGAKPNQILSENCRANKIRI